MLQNWKLHNNPLPQVYSSLINVSDMALCPAVSSGTQTLNFRLHGQKHRHRHKSNNFLDYWCLGHIHQGFLVSFLKHREIMSKLDRSIVATDFKSQGVNVTDSTHFLHSTLYISTWQLHLLLVILNHYLLSRYDSTRMRTNKTREKTSANKNTEFHITHPISYAQTVDINHTSIRHINTNIYTLVWWYLSL